MAVNLLKGEIGWRHGVRNEGEMDCWEVRNRGICSCGLGMWEENNGVGVRRNLNRGKRKGL